MQQNIGMNEYIFNNAGEQIDAHKSYATKHLNRWIFILHMQQNTGTDTSPYVNKYKDTIHYNLQCIQPS